MNYRWQQTLFQGYLVVSSIFTGGRRAARAMPPSDGSETSGVRREGRRDERG